MGAVVGFSNEAFSSRPESFNSILFTLLHFLIRIGLDTGNGFASMNFIRVNGVPIEIADNFDWIDFAFDFHLIGFHSFLNFSTDLTQSGINACFFQPCIGGILYSIEQVVVDRIEGHSESTVDYPSFDVGAEIDFADVVVGEHSIISGVGSVMCGHMV